MLSILALCGAGYNAVLLTRQLPPRRLVVLGPDRAEFNRVDPSKPLKHTFTLYNPTWRPIRVQRVRTGCTCTTSKLNDEVIGPGKTVPLEVQIRTFKSFVSRFAEPTFVETEDGPLEVWMTGSLDTPPRVLYYPQALYIEPDAAGDLPERLIRLKIPDTCALARDKWVVRLTGAVGGDARVVADQPSPQYRELVIRLTPLAPGPERPARGALRVSVGCAPFDIPIHVSP